MAKNHDWVITKKFDCVEYESMNCCKILMAGIEELRREDKLLDVTLVADGKSFKAHRTVLAACSPYFKALFTASLKEANENEINLIGVSALGLRMFIDYVYTAKLELSQDNVSEALATANYVQAPAIKWACADYLESQIDMDNCVVIMSIAQMFSLTKVKNKTSLFMCGNLEEFSSSGEINRLSWQQLEDVLSSGYPMNCSEIVVLELVLQWLSNNEVDHNAACRLLDKIYYVEIKPSSLNDIVCDAIFNKHCHHEALKSCVQKVEPFEYVDIHRAFYEARDEILVNSRGMEKALFMIGGFEPSGVTNQISYYLPSRKTWYKYTSIPHVEQSSYGTAVVGNDLYIVGGTYDNFLKEHIHPFGFRLSPTKRRWDHLARMQQDRCRFSLNAVGKFLYAVCGANTDPEESWHQEIVLPSNCERYDISTNKWEYFPALPENRSQHSGAVHESFLYISGGLDKNLVFSSLWRYDTKTCDWIELAPMLKARADHVMLAIEGKLYVCGGWYEHPETNERTLCTTIDVYDIVTNTWSIETHFTTPRFHASFAALNEQIFIIGGLYESRDPRQTSGMDCYDIKTKSWIEFEDFPRYIWESTCMVIYMPRYRDDEQLLPQEQKKPTLLDIARVAMIANYIDYEN